ncbi:MAG: MBL fold metallo-hydrolase [Rhodobacterales bacterium]|nr:MBL fold metallo-hydrolase [Rhodobacterales bacterium]
MKLTLLGTGTPRPSVHRNCTANLLQIGRENIIIDAGRGVVTQLANIGVDPNAIDVIFITHHHFDHIGNLADLLLAGWNNGRAREVRVYGPEGTAAIIDAFWSVIYARDIAFRLKETEFLDEVLPDIRKQVVVRDIAVGEVVKGAGWQVQAFQVDHGHALDMTHEEWPCYGYRIEGEERILGISGDTVDCAGARALAEGADLLVQCCYLAEAAVDSKDLRILVDHVLASAKQAGEIAQAAGAKRMVLTHLAPQDAAALQVVLNEARDGYDGEVILGADLMAFDL